MLPRRLSCFKSFGLRTEQRWPQQHAVSRTSMNASALLSKQGWRGSGFSLDQTNRGLAKPLLVSRKVDALGLGTKKDDFANQWWLKAWDTPISSQPTTPNSEPSATHIPATVTSRISGRAGLYSHFIKAETLGGTINDIPSVPPNDMSNTKEPETHGARKEKKDGQKRKRGDDQEQDTSDKKKSKKTKKEKKDRKARDLTPSAEDVEDVFFVDITGSATTPAKNPPQSVAEVKQERASAMTAKREKKLRKKQDKKDDKLKNNKVGAKDASNVLAASGHELQTIDANADFVSLSGKRVDPDAAPQKESMTSQQSKGASSEGEKKQAKRKSPKEIPSDPGAASKKTKKEKYAHEAAKRKLKRETRDKITTPEQKQAQAEHKKELKKLRKEKAAAKAADKEAKALSRNQRKAAKRASRKEARDRKAATYAAQVV